MPGLNIPSEIYEKLKPGEAEAELNHVDGWNFVQKKVFEKEGVLSGDGGLPLPLQNPYGDQKLKIEIRPRFDPAGFDDSRNLLLTDFTNSNMVWTGSDKVTCDFSAGGVLRLKNTGSTAGTCTAVLSSTFNLSFKRALGLEVTGDGKKEFVTVNLIQDSFAYRDFQFPLDSSIRKTLVNTQPLMTDKDLSGYDAQGNPLYLAQNLGQRSWAFNYSKTTPVNIRVAAGPGEYTIQLHSLKALQEKDNNCPLVNPTIAVNGKTIMFPVTLYVDDDRANILEYNGYAKEYKLFTSNYKLLLTGKVERDPIIVKSGENSAVFKADTSASANSIRGDFRLTVQDDEDNDGIPTTGVFPGSISHVRQSG